MSANRFPYTFLVDDGAVQDLHDAIRENPDEGDLLAVILEEMRGDLNLCAKLIDPGYQDEVINKVEPFWAVQSDGYNAYTVRFYDVHDWRMITAVDHKSRTIAVLYIMRRDENYDSTVQGHVAEAYDRLGLGRLGRS
ncbi:hypothetical protein P7B04_06915 [Sphingobium yanoikuyae]|uniref:hypothetical protein n=1 Tax=Sphingobium yanoikuyae TaxID=13690 RepID=UPI00240F9330|nr:hypothetical protein [Sphingobium yanoikuyae]MDG2512426.1 hypothetical protein [Sphingobium yanoikuyae]